MISITITTQRRTLQCFSILRQPFRLTSNSNPYTYTYSYTYTTHGHRHRHCISPPSRSFRSATEGLSNKPHNNSNTFQSSRSVSFKSLQQRPSTLITASAMLVVVLTSIFLISYYSQALSDNRNTLLVDRFKPYRIKSIKYLSQDTALLEIEIEIPVLQADVDYSDESAFLIESIFLKHPALQIERPYTPLSAPSQNHPSGIVGPDQGQPSTPTVELLIKRYPDGDLSTYLYRERLPGHHVEVRGPVPTWRHEGSQIDELIFIAAGTGITPAIQLLRRLYKRPSRPGFKLPKFKLIYLSNSLESAHAMAEIQQFCSRFPHLISSRLIVEKAPNQSSPPVDKVGRLELADLQRWLGDNCGSDRGRMILVCGPDGLINAVAGPKGRDMVSQGALGGMLKTLGYSSDQVYKL